MAIVGFGEVEPETTDSATDAVEAAGGEVSSVAILGLPPDVPALADAAGPRFADERPGPDRGSDLGVAIGRRLVGGGRLLDRVNEQLFSRFNGTLEGVTRVVLVSQGPDALEADVNGEGRAFEAALLSGIGDRALGAAGVERSSTDPTTLQIFSTAEIPTVDDVDQKPGQVALIFALLGAEGSFGVKDGASSLLPELLPEQAGAVP